MLKQFCIFFHLAVLGWGVTGCRQESVATMDGALQSRMAQTELEHWLETEYSLPYNIEVVYRRSSYKEDGWDDDLPPETNKIRPLMEALKDLWMVPLEQAVGNDFLKRYAPRQIVLKGNPNLNFLRVGEIESHSGEAVMPLFNVNRFSPDDKEMLFTYVRMAAFSFAKRLVQGKVPVIDQFAALNHGAKYHAWSEDPDTPREEYPFHGTPFSWRQGFFSNGAMENAVCDFSETFSMLTCLPLNEINDCLNTAQELGGEEAKAVLLRKMAFMDDFLWNRFKIRREVQLTRVISTALKHYKQPYGSSEPQ